MSKKNELVVKPTDEQLAILRNSYPVEESFQRTLLPRLGMASQDVTEGKGKAMKVVREAGTFFIEKQTDEKNESGKSIWSSDEIGTEIDVVILFERKQLRYYDGEKYTSSPVYDTNDQVLPLFKDKQEVDRGTVTELRTRPIYQGLSAKGKAISKLEENRILYVLYKDEMYQLNIRGTSLYSFLDYKKTVRPNEVVTHLESESKENGAISWNQMTFDEVRPINSEESDSVITHLKDIQDGISAEKTFYNSKAVAKKEEDDF